MARVHRRDRRKTAPNTPGGVVKEFISLAFKSNTSATVFTLDAARLQPQAGGTGWTPVTGWANRLIPTSGWYFRQGGANFAVDTVNRNFDGTITITIAGGRDNAGWLLVPPFVADLVSTKGEMCAGGLIFIPSPI